MACRAEPDLVAVYESPNGSLALLLRHTMAPLAEEQPLWREATHRAAGAIMGRLRRANLAGQFVVLQWLPLHEVARILRHWTCRYDGDTERRAQIARVVESHLADRAFLASVRAIEEGPSGWSPAERGERPACLEQVADRPGLRRWYRAMMPCWWAVEPPTRQALVFATHRWVVERILVPIARGRSPAFEDLSWEGRLAQIFGEIAADEVDEWRYWIRLVLRDLQQALVQSAGPPDEAWARRLFLIPYSIPMRRRAAPPLRPPRRRDMD